MMLPEDYNTLIIQEWTGILFITQRISNILLEQIHNTYTITQQISNTYI